MITGSKTPIEKLPRAFQWLVTTDVLATMATSVYTIVILYVVQTHFANLLLNGFVGALNHLPILLGALGIGALVDRLPRRQLMILTNLTMGILAWIPLAVNRHVAWGYAVIIGVDFLIQTALYVDELSHNAYLKYLVTSRQLPKAEGILQSTASGGFIVGLGVVFGLLKYGKVPFFLLLSTVGFAITSALIFLLPQDNKPVNVNRTPQSVFEMSRIGLMYLFRDRGLRWYTYQSLLANVAVNVLLALVVYDMGHRGFFHPFPLVVVIAAGLGMGLSGAVVSAGAKHVPMMGLITIGRIAFGGGLIGVAMAHHLLLFAMSLGLVFFGQNLSGTVLMTWRTQHTPLDLQGRISGSIAQISSLTSWIGVLVISGIGAIFHSTALPFMLAGGIALLSLVVLLIGVVSHRWTLPRYLTE